MLLGKQNVQWIVQKNLTGKEDFEALQNACNRLGFFFSGVNIIPFSQKLPVFSRQTPSIFYGSTTFTSLVYQDPELRCGLFFNEATFSIENYFKKWGEYMLNYGSTVSTFRELINGIRDAEELLFIRPNDDSKSFDGEVVRFGEIKEWYEKLLSIGNPLLSPDSKIVVSEPYEITAEWRLWIVNKRAVAASKYREYFKLKKEEGCPEEVKLFAERRCQEYTPHDVFVMDICLCGDSYFIVECGCMNAAGFYNVNIEEVVKAVTGYFISSL